jgi:hypothetical protein
MYRSQMDFQSWSFDTLQKNESVHKNQDENS